MSVEFASLLRGESTDFCFPAGKTKKEKEEQPQTGRKVP